MPESEYKNQNKKDIIDVFNNLVTLKWANSILINDHELIMKIIKKLVVEKEQYVIILFKIIHDYIYNQLTKEKKNILNDPNIIEFFSFLEKKVDIFINFSIENQKNIFKMKQDNKNNLKKDINGLYSVSFLNELILTFFLYFEDKLIKEKKEFCDKWLNFIIKIVEKCNKLNLLEIKNNLNNEYFLDFIKLINKVLNLIGRFMTKVVKKKTLYNIIDNPENNFELIIKKFNEFSINGDIFISLIIKTLKATPADYKIVKEKYEIFLNIRTYVSIYPSLILKNINSLLDDDFFHSRSPLITQSEINNIYFFWITTQKYLIRSINQNNIINWDSNAFIKFIENLLIIVKDKNTFSNFVLNCLYHIKSTFDIYILCFKKADIPFRENFFKFCPYLVKKLLELLNSTKYDLKKILNNINKNKLKKKQNFEKNNIQINDFEISEEKWNDYFENYSGNNKPFATKFLHDQEKLVINSYIMEGKPNIKLQQFIEEGIIKRITMLIDIISKVISELLYRNYLRSINNNNSLNYIGKKIHCITVDIFEEECIYKLFRIYLKISKIILDNSDNLKNITLESIKFSALEIFERKLDNQEGFLRVDDWQIYKIYERNIELSLKLLKSLVINHKENYVHEYTIFFDNFSTLCLKLFDIKGFYIFKIFLEVLLNKILILIQELDEEIEYYHFLKDDNINPHIFLLKVIKFIFRIWRLKEPKDSKEKNTETFYHQFFKLLPEYILKTIMILIKLSYKKKYSMDYLAVLKIIFKASFKNIDFFSYLTKKTSNLKIRLISFLCNLFNSNLIELKVISIEMLLFCPMDIRIFLEENYKDIAKMLVFGFKLINPNIINKSIQFIEFISDFLSKKEMNYMFKEEGYKLMKRLYKIFNNSNKSTFFRNNNYSDTNLVYKVSKLIEKLSHIFTNINYQELKLNLKEKEDYDFSLKIEGLNFIIEKDISLDNKSMNLNLSKIINTIYKDIKKLNKKPIIYYLFPISNNYMYISKIKHKNELDKIYKFAFNSLKFLLNNVEILKKNSEMEIYDIIHLNDNNFRGIKKLFKSCHYLIKFMFPFFENSKSNDIYKFNEFFDIIFEMDTEITVDKYYKWVLILNILLNNLTYYFKLIRENPCDSYFKMIKDYLIKIYDHIVMNNDKIYINLDNFKNFLWDKTIKLLVDYNYNKNMAGYMFIKDFWEIKEKNFINMKKPEIVISILKTLEKYSINFNYEIYSNFQNYILDLYKEETSETIKKNILEILFTRYKNDYTVSNKIAFNVLINIKKMDLEFLNKYWETQYEDLYVYLKYKISFVINLLENKFYYNYSNNNESLNKILIHFIMFLNLINHLNIIYNVFLIFEKNNLQDTFRLIFKILFLNIIYCDEFNQFKMNNRGSTIEISIIKNNKELIKEKIKIKDKLSNINKLTDYNTNYNNKNTLISSKNIQNEIMKYSNINSNTQNKNKEAFKLNSENYYTDTEFKIYVEDYDYKIKEICKIISLSLDLIVNIFVNVDIIIKLFNDIKKFLKYRDYIIKLIYNLLPRVEYSIKNSSYNSFIKIFNTYYKDIKITPQDKLFSGIKPLIISLTSAKDFENINQTLLNSFKKLLKLFSKHLNKENLFVNLNTLINYFTENLKNENINVSYNDIRLIKSLFKILYYLVSPLNVLTIINLGFSIEKQLWIKSIHNSSLEKELHKIINKQFGNKIIKFFKDNLIEKQFSKFFTQSIKINHSLIMRERILREDIFSYLETADSEIYNKNKQLIESKYYISVKWKHIILIISRKNPFWLKNNYQIVELCIKRLDYLLENELDHLKFINIEREPLEKDEIIILAKIIFIYLKFWNKENEVLFVLLKLINNLSNYDWSFIIDYFQNKFIHNLNKEKCFELIKIFLEQLKKINTEKNSYVLSFFNYLLSPLILYFNQDFIKEEDKIKFYLIFYDFLKNIDNIKYDSTFFSLLTNILDFFISKIIIKKKTTEIQEFLKKILVFAWSNIGYPKENCKKLKILSKLLVARLINIYNIFNEDKSHLYQLMTSTFYEHEDIIDDEGKVIWIDTCKLLIQNQNINDWGESFIRAMELQPNVRFINDHSNIPSRFWQVVNYNHELFVKIFEFMQKSGKFFNGVTTLVKSDKNLAVGIDTLGNFLKYILFNKKGDEILQNYSKQKKDFLLKLVFELLKREEDNTALLTNKCFFYAKTIFHLLKDKFNSDLENIMNIVKEKNAEIPKENDENLKKLYRFNYIVLNLILIILQKINNEIFLKEYNSLINFILKDLQLNDSRIYLRIPNIISILYKIIDYIFSKLDNDKRLKLIGNLVFNSISSIKSILENWNQPERTRNNTNPFLPIIFIHFANKYNYPIDYENIMSIYRLLLVIINFLHGNYKKKKSNEKLINLKKLDTDIVEDYFEKNYLYNFDIENPSNILTYYKTFIVILVRTITNNSNNKNNILISNYNNTIKLNKSDTNNFSIETIINIFRYIFQKLSMDDIDLKYDTLILLRCIIIPPKYNEKYFYKNYFNSSLSFTEKLNLINLLDHENCLMFKEGDIEWYILFYYNILLLLYDFLMIYNKHDKIYEFLKKILKRRFLMIDYKSKNILYKMINLFIKQVGINKFYSFFINEKYSNDIYTNNIINKFIYLFFNDVKNNAKIKICYKNKEEDIYKYNIIENFLDLIHSENFGNETWLKYFCNQIFEFVWNFKNDNINLKHNEVILDEKKEYRYRYKLFKILTDLLSSKNLPNEDFNFISNFLLKKRPKLINNEYIQNLFLKKKSYLELCCKLDSSEFWKKDNLSLYILNEKLLKKLSYKNIMYGLISNFIDIDDVDGGFVNLSIKNYSNSNDYFNKYLNNIIINESETLYDDKILEENYKLNKIIDGWTEANYELNKWDILEETSYNTENQNIKFLINKDPVINKKLIEEINFDQNEEDYLSLLKNYIKYDKEIFKIKNNKILNHYKENLLLKFIDKIKNNKIYPTEKINSIINYQKKYFELEEGIENFRVLQKTSEIKDLPDYKNLIFHLIFGWRQRDFSSNMKPSEIKSILFNRIELFELIQNNTLNILNNKEKEIDLGNQFDNIYITLNDSLINELKWFKISQKNEIFYDYNLISTFEHPKLSKINLEYFRILLSVNKEKELKIANEILQNIENSLYSDDLNSTFYFEYAKHQYKNYNYNNSNNYIMKSLNLSSHNYKSWDLLFKLYRNIIIYENNPKRRSFYVEELIICFVNSISHSSNRKNKIHILLMVLKLENEHLEKFGENIYNKYKNNIEYLLKNVSLKILLNNMMFILNLFLVKTSNPIEEFIIKIIDILIVFYPKELYYDLFTVINYLKLKNITRFNFLQDYLDLIVFNFDKDIVCLNNLNVYFNDILKENGAYDIYWIDKIFKNIYKNNVLNQDYLSKLIFSNPNVKKIYEDINNKQNISPAKKLIDLLNSLEHIKKEYLNINKNSTIKSKLINLKLYYYITNYFCFANFNRKKVYVWDIIGNIKIKNINNNIVLKLSIISKNGFKKNIIVYYEKNNIYKNMIGQCREAFNKLLDTHTGIETTFPLYNNRDFINISENIVIKEHFNLIYPNELNYKNLTVHLKNYHNIISHIKDKKKIVNHFSKITKKVLFEKEIKNNLLKPEEYYLLKVNLSKSYIFREFYNLIFYLKYSFKDFCVKKHSCLVFFNSKINKNRKNELNIRLTQNFKTIFNEIMCNGIFNPIILNLIKIIENSEKIQYIIVFYLFNYYVEDENILNLINSGSFDIITNYIEPLVLEPLKKLQTDQYLKALYFNKSDSSNYNLSDIPWF